MANYFSTGQLLRSLPDGSLAYKNVAYGRAADGTLVELALNTDGELRIAREHSMEIFGATVASRPVATSVPVGCYFMAVRTGELWQSDGTEWVVK